MELKNGECYQVYHWEKGWVIAEYVGFLGEYEGRDMFTSKMVTLPARHSWRFVHSGNQFLVDAKKMQTRPCSPDSLEKLGALKEEIARLGRERQEKINELRELCA